MAVCHIVYAFILTAQNRRARGDNRYAVTEKPATVEWASQNMLVLGIIVLLGLGLHFFNFWYNMMFAELIHTKFMYEPSNGFAYIKYTFANPVYVETRVDSDRDGLPDLIKVSIIRPTYHGKIPAVMTASPYHQGTNDKIAIRTRQDKVTHH